MEPEDAFQKTFTIYPAHLEYLKTIDSNNISSALRQILDNSMHNNQRFHRRQIIDKTITWSCFGAIFLLLSYILTGITTLISIGIGTLLFAYGTIGGAVYAIQRTRNNR